MSSQQEAESKDQVVYSSKFPFNVFHFKEYDGWKLATVFIFLLSLYSFLKKYFWSIPHTHWWNMIPFIAPTLDIASFCGHFLLLTLAYCLLWLAFDPRSFLGYAASALTVVFGLIYIFNPVDFFPDLIPFVGGFDDSVIGGLSIFLGAISWIQAQQQDKNCNRALKALRDGDQQTALKLLLEERGIEIK